MESRTMRRGAVAAALLLGLGAGLPAARAANPQASITLNMWGWADRNLCAQDFQKSHPGITVKYTTQLTPIPKLNVLKRSGSSLPDVVFDNIEYAANYNQLGFISDLSSVVPAAVRAKYAPGSLGQLVQNGKLVGVPHDEAAIGIWYNVNTLKASGLKIPTSYAQIYADAATLAKTKKYAISWFGADSWGLVTLAWANHANWFTLNKDGSWTVNIDTPLTEKLATDYVAAIRSGGVLPDDPFGPVSAKAYAQSTVAYAVGPNWLGAYGIQPGYPKQKGQWNFMASLPSVGWWGGGAFYVPPQTTHPTEAKELAVYCSTSPTFQSQVGTMPSYAGVYNVAGALKPNSFFNNPTSVIAQMKLSTTHTATGWTWSPNQSYVDTQVQAVTAAMINGLSVHTELQRLQSQVISNLKLTGVNVK
jgi:multiple sugar transport system substrate-binding protein